MTYLQVSDIMTKKPVRMKATDSIYAAADLMKKYRISSVIILDEFDKLAGILTVDDIVRQAVATRMDMQTVVSEIMTAKVITLTADRDVTDVMNLFSEYEIRQAPVLDSEKSVIGFVTLKDILRFEPAMLDLAVESLKQEETSRREAIQRFVDTQEMPDEELF